ncbi:MAG: carbohydrate ABC transporter permease [Candidatus Omnitrophica bacterium]|nr:carbohydrate ABC transporter permease [Candidatus Omnitrophota bacterium]MDD5081307.1 carbohydrate ABC transporter permease [Candidatus Omnitrophota bacterium]MDD5440787.1 carbohydrate ABC transporter permease [Candidatus Omnitrophota bacterium]
MLYQIKKVIFVIFLHIFLMSVALSCIFPFIWMMNVSLETQTQYDQDYGLRPVTNPNFQNYKTVIIDEGFWRYFLNSFVYTFVTVIFIVLVSSLAAYAFSRLNFPGKNFIFYMFLAAMMIPLPAGFVPVYTLLQQFGLLNRTGYVLAMTNIGLSISIYLLKTFFDQLPRDLEDAAKIDGCSKLQTWWHVGLPLVMPALGVVIIFNALNVWNEFVLASLMFSKDSYMPLQAGLMQFSGKMVTEHTLIMAALTVAALPIIFLYLKMQKQFVRGLTAGAVVG